MSQQRARVKRALTIAEARAKVIQERTPKKIHIETPLDDIDDEFVSVKKGQHKFEYPELQPADAFLSLDVKRNISKVNLFLYSVVMHSSHCGCLTERYFRPIFHN
jgi:hypothetical protein